MVEDGHLANSHSYGSSTYYRGDLNTKSTNNHNNNNNNSAASNSCIVVVERDKRGKPVAAVTPASRLSNSTNSILVATTANNTNDSHLRNHLLPTNETTSKSTTTSLHIEKSLNSAFSPQQSSTGATLTAESNGSSHMADQVDATATPPHHNHHPHPTSHHDHQFYDVTKDVEHGGTRMLTTATPTAGTLGTCSNSHFPPEIHKTVMAFGILIFNFFLTTTSLAIIHDKVPPHGPLPDTVLDMFEAHSWALIVSEVLIIVTTGIMLIIIITHQHRFIIFRRLFLMLSLLYFMRSVTMFVTVLPVSSNTYFCSPKSQHPSVATILSRSMSLFLGMGLTLNGHHVYCGDYIYSGHTTILVMSYLMISEYSPRRVRWLHWATWAMSLTGVLMVLLSHSHYTVDVIIGYFVTTRLFWMYHTCANNQFLKKSIRYNYLTREWWYFLFQYFECNVNGPLQPLEYR